MKALGVFTVFAGIAFSAPAFAGNPYPAPSEPAPAAAPAPQNDRWTGPYVGLGAGWTFLDGERSSADLPDNDFEPDGFTVHGLAGWNVRLQGIVVGIEGEIGYTDDDEKFVVTGNGFDVGSDFTFAVRARAGLPLGNVLYYVAGGLAGADYEVNDIGFGRDSGTLIGWTAGVGADLAISERIALRGEVNYIDYGSEDFSAGGFPDEIDLDGVSARVAVLFAF